MNPNKALKIFRLLKEINVSDIFQNKMINFEKLLEALASEQNEKINEICNIIKDTKKEKYIDDIFLVLEVISSFLLFLLQKTKESKNFAALITGLTGVNIIAILESCQSTIKLPE